jgi:glycerol kinase
MGVFGIPGSVLPEVRPSSEIYGETIADLFGHPIPIAGVAGDQQAALFGQACFEPGMGKNTYGTGAFVVMNTGEEPVLGRDGLGLIEDARDVEKLARSVTDNGGVYFVPALVGLGSPYWDPYARGLIVGLTRGSRKAHLARASIEAMAFQTCDAIEAMQSASGIALRELRADGGAAANNLLLQFQADLLNTPVLRPQVTETTALGAAYLAGIGIGLLDQDSITRRWALDHRCEPDMDPDIRKDLLGNWKRAVERSRGWVE